jgi:hypothetical protein
LRRQARLVAQLTTKGAQCLSHMTGSLAFIALTALILGRLGRALFRDAGRPVSDIEDKPWRLESDFTNPAPYADNGVAYSSSAFAAPPNCWVYPPARPLLTTPPRSEPEWVHEIKFDGYRLIALKDAGRVVLWSRYATTYTDTFLRIAEAVRGHRQSNSIRRRVARTPAGKRRLTLQGRATPSTRSSVSA